MVSIKCTAANDLSGRLIWSAAIKFIVVFISFFFKRRRRRALLGGCYRFYFINTWPEHPQGFPPRANHMLFQNTRESILVPRQKPECSSAAVREDRQPYYFGRGQQVIILFSGCPWRISGTHECTHTHTDLGRARTKKHTKPSSVIFLLFCSPAFGVVLRHPSSALCAREDPPRRCFSVAIKDATWSFCL